MKLNIKKTALALTTTVPYLLAAGSAFATTNVSTFNVCDPNHPQFNILCRQGAANLGTIVFGIVVILFVISVVVALIFLIWGGLKWIFSGGDKAAVESARNTIIAAIIGLVIVFAAFFLLNLVTQILIGQSIQNLSITTLFQ